MDLYKVIYNSEEDGDVYGISIVDDPANGSLYMALSEQKQVMLKTADDKKKVLTGVVLIPEQKIYREFEDGTPFQLMFDAPTIERIAQDFLRKGYQKNTTFNHDGNNWLEGTSLVESWIVEDPNNDKLTALGFKGVVKGTWAVSMKLNDALWNEYIETGLARGFSIDSMIRFEKINLNNKIHNTMDLDKNKEEKMSVLKKLIKLFSEETITLASAESVELGPLTADAFEVGNVVYDADLQPVMDAEFTIEGKVYKTDETGLIVEVADVAEENADAPEDPAMADTAMEDVDPAVAEEVKVTADEIVAEVEKQVEDIDVQALLDKIATLQADIEKLTAQQEAIVMENTELKLKATTTKLKAEVKGQSPIVLANQEKSTESTLDALSRITKKNNK